MISRNTKKVGDTVISNNLTGGIIKNLFLIFIVGIMLNLSATIINIPADQPTIQAGINVATDSDTILVQPGTYIENINFNGKNIIVASVFLTTQDTSYISQMIIRNYTNRVK